jgi:hypothetical protein
VLSLAAWLPGPLLFSKGQEFDDFDQILSAKK